MTALTAYLETHSRRVLIVGLPGSGKSTLAAELANIMKVIWIDTENGVGILHKLSPAAQKNVEVLALKDSASYPIAAETLLILFKTGKVSCCAIHSKNNCPLCKKLGDEAFTTIDLTTLGTDTVVVLDTATQLANSLLSHITRSKPVETKFERDDWGQLRKFTDFFTSQFQAANFNLVVLCHLTEATLDNGQTKLVPNFGSANASASFAKAFDEVIYCEVKNKKHVAYSSSTALMNVVTKSRGDFLIEALETPSLIPLFQKKEGEK